jgi:hypothetical protein
MYNSGGGYFGRLLPIGTPPSLPCISTGLKK